MQEPDLPFFSVIIPVYNKESHISCSISSILEQSFSNFELIVVCDPSTDNSNAEVEKFADSRLRIFYRDEPGPGGYAARNLGIQYAQGKYISFLDADDEWWRGHLAYHYRLISESNCPIVATSWLDCWEGESPSFNAADSDVYDGTVLHTAGFLRKYLDQENVLHTNTISIERSLFESCGGFPDGECKRGGDVGTWLKLVCATGIVCVSPKETAIYYRENSTVTKEQCPDVENNCVRLHVERLIATLKLAPEEQTLLKKLSNKHLVYGLVSRASSGELRIADSCYLYGKVDPGIFCFFRLFGLLPEVFQRLIWSVYRKARA